MPEPQKYLESLQSAINNVRIADHMLYMTFPLIKDKRLLIKTLEQVYQAGVYTINSILQYDYINKRIQLVSDPKQNFDTFLLRCAKRYNLYPEEIDGIIELFAVVECHKQSPMEFLRKDKIIILSENLKTNTLEPEKLKKYLNLVKNLINKAKFGMNIH